MLWSPDRPKDMRIVITGMGIVAPGANDVETYWRNLINGKSALEPFDIDELAKEKGFIGENAQYTHDVRLVGRVKIDPVEHLQRYKVKFAPKRFNQRVAPEAQILICSAVEALSQSGVLLPDGTINPSIDKEEVTVRMGTILGPSLNISRYQNHIDHQKHEPEQELYGIMHIDPQRLSTMTANFFDFQGGPETSASACSSGGSALSGGIADILLNDARYCLVGASDLAIHPHLITQLDNARALSHENDPRMCRPFDKNYTGVFMGEGAAVLFIETLESAQERHAKILAEITGYGKAGENSDFDPSGKGISLALRRSIRRSGPMKTKGYDFNHTHSAGTKGDETEVESAREARKKLGYDESHWAVGSSKWQGGHPWGPAVLNGVIVGVKALNEDILPPSPNLETPIMEDVDFVQGEARPERVGRVSVTGQGLGGGATAHTLEIPGK